jgi:hypothetical protein
MLEDSEERLSVAGAALYVIVASIAFFVLIGLIAGYARWTVATAALWTILHALIALSGGRRVSLESLPWWEGSFVLVLGFAAVGTVPRILSGKRSSRTLHFACIERTGSIQRR